MIVVSQVVIRINTSFYNNSYYNRRAKIKSVIFSQKIRTDHSATGTGYSYFTLIFTLNFEYDDNDEITSINITSTGFEQVGSYLIRDFGSTINEITYYE